MDTEDEEKTIPSYNMRITYYNNLKTGQLTLNIDYLSSPNTRPEQHRDQHWKYIGKILAGLGQLVGGLSVRVTQDNLLSIYQVKRESETSDWQIIKVTSQQITEMTDPQLPAPSLNEPEREANQELDIP